MLNNLKALVVILTLAWAAFHFARPLCLQYMSAEAFDRRRNVWFALTIGAFFSPAFWMYGIFALVLMYWAGKRDENPLALYVLVAFVVPNVRYFIPTFLINQLFDLTQFRMLSLVILIPAIVRSWNDPLRSSGGKLRGPDYLLLGFLLVQVGVQMPYESVTAVMRRAFLLTIDVFVVLYAFSRIVDRHKLSEVWIMFWLASGVMALVGIFEWSKTWLLYTGLSFQWGDPNEGWLFRGSSLRAQASSGHSLALGHALAIALGCYLYLRARSKRRWFDWAVFGALCVGLYATGSRGSWLMAMLVVAVFTAFRPGAAKKLGGALAMGALLISVMYVTPLKEKVIDRLPIIGTSDQDTIDYRQQLWDTSLPLIRQNPWFGDPFVARNMESMRQGQGIIDIINGYLMTALFYGLVGLSLQVAVLLAAFWKAAVGLWRIRALDSEDGLLGASLVAAFAGLLFFIATAGFGPTTYVLAGVLLSYARIVGQRSVSASPAASPAARQPISRRQGVA